MLKIGRSEWESLNNPVAIVRQRDNLKQIDSEFQFSDQIELGRSRLDLQRSMKSFAILNPDLLNGVDSADTRLGDSRYVCFRIEKESSRVGMNFAL